MRSKRCPSPGSGITVTRRRSARGAIGDVPDVTLVEVTGVAWAFVTWLTTTRYVCPLG